MNIIIEQFYSAFQKLDAEEMVKYYHADIEFEDPAFGKLNSDKAKNMWRMLCKSSKELEVTFSNINCDDKKGSANWEAKYIFSKTGRKIHNKITAEFEFHDGKIIKHKDNFNLHKWAAQAFGLKGLLFGWTPVFKTKLNAETNKLLDVFERRNKL
ncbi:MAG: nuclear transport factor 2 family protein [Melioribacteraceae bacterium]|nr:nuclear transport factor 2 family protein [Melioribacteraceae bacterium]